MAYYQKIRKELGYDMSPNEDYPEVHDAAAISQMISLRKIVIPIQSRYGKNAVWLAYNCTWNAENGLGVCLLNDIITEIGFEDIVI